MPRNPLIQLWLFLFLLQVFPGASSHAAITVVSYWRLGENDPGAANGVTATNMVDIAGTHNLTVHGTARYTNDVATTAVNRTGSSLSVNFTNGAYATSAIVVTNVDDFGIECWVKPGQMNSNQVIAYNGTTGGAGSGGWGLYIAANNTYQVLLGGLAAFGTNAVVSNVWTYLALVRASGFSTLYINGVAVATDAGNPGAPSGNFALATTPQSPTSQFFTGLIDEVRVFTFAPGQFNTKVLLWNQSAVTTLPATALSSTNAALDGAINPGGVNYTGWFQYGLTTNYGSVTPTTFVSGTNPAAVPISDVIGGLSPGITYHFRLVGSNAASVVFGADLAFTLPVLAVTTFPATALISTNAELNGTLTPYGIDTTAWFQYGLTTNYGSVTPTTFVSGTDSAAVSISDVIGGLAPQSTYHFRLVGSNTTSVVFGADLAFTLPLPVAPGISGQSAGSITYTNAVLNAMVTANGADTTAWFQYGLTTNYGSSTPSTFLSGTNPAAVPVSDPVSPLSLGTIYHFQLVATNVAGTSYGGDQTFSTLAFVQTNTPFPGFLAASVAGGDFDDDGLMDVLLMGEDLSLNTYTQLWLNTGSVFTNDINAGLDAVGNGSVAWGDFNNDGLLDILLCGATATNALTEVWLNTGSGFSNINAGLPGVFAGTAAWGDYDNDGRPDILLCGLSDAGPITQVWRNTGSGFTNINAGLPGIFDGAAVWGDFDNDGRPDILLCGYDGVAPITQVWRNTTNGFVEYQDLPGVQNGTVAWGDFDNDGRLDILLCGYTGGGYITQVWRNTGNGFTNINAGLPGIQGTAVWGDYDNDGQLDILLCGYDGVEPITQVWRNTGNGFAKIQDFPGVDGPPGAAWGDFNNDGRLDILFSGEQADGTLTTQLWLNQTPQTNSPPTAPTGLSAAALGSTLTLSWNASSDLQTPAPGLSYNLRVGTTPGGSDLLAPMADTNGMRLVPQRGNVQGTQKTLQLPVSVGTTVYWSVQSIDTSFAGSPFAPEASVVLQPFFTSSGLASDGTFEAQFDVLSGTNYTIQASTDLVHWVDLLDFTFGTSGPFLFTDPDATNYPQRYYRFGQH